MSDNMKLLKIQIILLQISTAFSKNETSLLQNRRSRPLGEFVRLVNGSTPNEGRVEIYYNRQWGTICGDYFGYDEARAVCSALGYRNGIPFLHGHFGIGTGPIFVSNLHCSVLDSGSHSLILGKSLCYFKGWGVSNCHHEEDVGVKCKTCDEGKFDYACLSICHCKVPGCDSVTGVCHTAGCLPGWRGASCSNACAAGTFGQSCSSKCHCKHLGCFPETGVCVYPARGCQPGWKGDSCDQADQNTEEQNSNTVGYQVAVSLLVILLALAVILIIGICIKYKRIKGKHDQPTTAQATVGADVNRGLFAIALPKQGGLQNINRNGRANIAFHGAHVDIHLDGFARNHRHK